MGNNPNDTDWKSNRAIVASIAAVAGFGFCYQFILPTHSVALRNEIDANAKLVANASATAEELTTVKHQLKDALGRITALENPNLFSLGNPYPVGLGLVKIGQPIDDVEKAYVGARIQKNERYWTLVGFHSVFPYVSYHFHDEGGAKKVTMISFFPTPEKNDNFVINKLVEVLGPPTDAIDKPKGSAWRLDDAKMGVHFDTDRVPSYTIVSLEFYNKWLTRKRPSTTGAIPATKGK